MVLSHGVKPDRAGILRVAPAWRAGRELSQSESNSGKMFSRPGQLDEKVEVRINEVLKRQATSPARTVKAWRMFNATCSPSLPTARMEEVAEGEQRPASTRAPRKL